MSGTIDALLETIKASKHAAFDAANKGLVGDNVPTLKEAVAQNPALHSLDVSHNQLGLAGASLIDSGVLQLNLSDTVKGTYGMMLAASAGERLKHNTSLVSLFLHQCDLSKSASRGVQVLFEGVAQNTYLAELGVMANHIKGDATMAISELVAKNRTLASLVLSFNQINDRDMEFLAMALKENKTLAHFDISQNDLGEGSKMMLAQAIMDGGSKNMVYAKVDIGGPLQQALDEKLEGNRNEALVLLRKLVGHREAPLSAEDVAAMNERMNAMMLVADRELHMSKEELGGHLAAAKADGAALAIPACLEVLSQHTPSAVADAATVEPQKQFHWLG